MIALPNGPRRPRAAWRVIFAWSAACSWPGLLAQGQPAPDATAAYQHCQELARSKLTRFDDLRFPDLSDRNVEQDVDASAGFFGFRLLLSGSHDSGYAGNLQLFCQVSWNRVGQRWETDNFVISATDATTLPTPPPVPSPWPWRALDPELKQRLDEQVLSDRQATGAREYLTELLTPLAHLPTSADCARQHPDSVSRHFTCYVRLDGAGRALETHVDPRSPFHDCLATQLRQATLPAPPRAPFWISWAASGAP